jgi:hypothetical protein
LNRKALASIVTRIIIPDGWIPFTIPDSHQYRSDTSEPIGSHPSTPGGRETARELPLLSMYLTQR